MSSISRDQVGKLIVKEAYPVMLDAYEAEPAVYKQVADVQPVVGAMYGTRGTVFTSLGEMKRVRDGENTPADTIEKAYAYQIRVDEFGSSISFPDRVLDANDATDVVIPKLRKFAQDWGRMAITTKEQRTADLFQKGTLAAGHLDTFDGSFPENPDPYPKFIYDGKPFFATDHPLAAAAGTYSNITVSNALNSANLQASLTTMRSTNAVNERGQKVRISPDTVIYGPGLDFTARALLNTVLVPGSANNDVNVVQGIVNPIMWRYLSDDADAWWLLQARMGVVAYDSGEPVLVAYRDDEKRETVFAVRCFFGVGVTNWRYAHANNKATS